MKVNLEGDVLISDDTIQGLGIAQKFLRIFFGSIFLVAGSRPQHPLPPNFVASLDMSEAAASPAASLSPVSKTLPPRHTEFRSAPETLILEAQDSLWGSFKSVLISCVPNPGYFVAGGVAGIVSRTSTAPLDRLKVYLIAQTDVAQEAVAASKSGNVLRALGNSWRPLAAATKELWKAGGMRSLYAGESNVFLVHHPAHGTVRKWLECGKGHAGICDQVWFI